MRGRAFAEAEIIPGGGLRHELIKRYVSSAYCAGDAITVVFDAAELRAKDNFRGKGGRTAAPRERERGLVRFSASRELPSEISRRDWSKWKLSRRAAR